MDARRTCHPAILDLTTGVNHVKGPIRQVEMPILGSRQIEKSEGQWRGGSNNLKITYRTRESTIADEACLVRALGGELFRRSAHAHSEAGCW